MCCSTECVQYALLVSFQEEELGRPIHNHQVLGNQVFDDDNDEEAPQRNE